MPSKSQIVKIDDQNVRITNLDKMIFPSIGIIKAEVIKYFLEIGPYLLNHIKDRPLTLIRYPDGVEGKKFYTKNKPGWTPDYVPYTKLPFDTGNEYLYADHLSHCVWLANLAALELHIMNSRIGSIEHPDHFVVDLDPSENQTFELVKEVALLLKQFFEKKGFVPFAKLSGGKGIHIIVPVKPNCTYDEMISKVKDMMKEFIRSNSNCTLAVHKDKRQNKTLLDIYRNHPGNTTIAAYSLRGRKGAPVSIPLTWPEIKEAGSAQDYNINNTLSYVRKNGDCWEDLNSFAVNIKLDVPGENSDLKKYSLKRDFSKTKEPEAVIDHDINGKYVVQLHQASNLHYDLRIGSEGVLKSWAIPKGLPTEKGIKRLAIQTEDHPAKYYDFEGKIPEDEYGGGEMWIFDQGKIDWIKKEDKKIHFTLKGNYINSEFILYNTKEDLWIIENRSIVNNEIFKRSFKPMLCQSLDHIPKDEKKYWYEVKWDGIRAFIIKKGDAVKILSKSGRDISENFPEFTDASFYEVEHCILDVELVCLDEIGRSVFADIISRMHSKGKARHKAYAYVLDCIALDGFDITSEILEKRKQWLSAILNTNDILRISNLLPNGKELFEAAKNLNLEGVIAKKKNSTYESGGRSSNWIKVKVRNTIDCHIIGYTYGSGDRADLFGSLHLAQKNEKELKYLGRCGTGFSHQQLKELIGMFNKLEKIKKPLKEKVEEEKSSVWIEAKYICEVKYASITRSGNLREPVFVRLKENL